jgi:hypothetical protein
VVTTRLSSDAMNSATDVIAKVQILRLLALIAGSYRSE